MKSDEQPAIAERFMFELGVVQRTEMLAAISAGQFAEYVAEHEWMSSEQASLEDMNRMIDRVTDDYLRQSALAWKRINEGH